MAVEAPSSGPLRQKDLWRVWEVASDRLGLRQDQLMLKTASSPTWKYARFLIPYICGV